MMHEGFFLVELLALISFIVSFSGQALVYGSPPGLLSPGVSIITQESDVPFWYGNVPAVRGPFPEFGGWQSLGVKEAGMQDELENALYRKGYHPSDIDERLNEIDDGRKESPVFEAAPKYDPGTQMVGDPFPHSMSSPQNVRLHSIKSNNNILEISERECGHHSSSVTVGKDPKQLALKSISSFPFWFQEPERNWYSYARQPSLFREPFWMHNRKDLKEQESTDPTANPHFETLAEQSLTIADGTNDGVLPGKLFRDQIITVLEKQLGLGGSGATNFRFASGEDDWVSNNENLHHLARKICKSFDKSEIFKHLVTLILAEVSGEDIENDEPVQEMRAQNDEGNPHTGMQNLDGPAKFMVRLPQAQTNDIQENKSVLKYRNSYHPDIKTDEVVKTFKSKPLLQLWNGSLTEGSDAGTENNERAQEPQAEGTVLQIEIRRVWSDADVPTLSEHSAGISGYTLLPGTSEIKELTSDGDKNPKVSD